MVKISCTSKLNGAKIDYSDFSLLKFYEEVLPERKIFKVFESKYCDKKLFCKNYLFSTCITHLWDNVLKEHCRNENWILKEAIFDDLSYVNFKHHFSSWNYGIDTTKKITSIFFINPLGMDKSDVKGWDILTTTNDKEEYFAYAFYTKRLRQVTFEKLGHKTIEDFL